MRALCTLFAGGLAVLTPSAAAAQPVATATATTARVVVAPDPSSPGDVLAVPPGQPRALLILLHGDNEPARATVRPWEALAAREHLLLFAPTCPRAQGCTAGSFWRWNADPAWLLAHAARLRTRFGLGVADTLLVGWSGGASYLGYRAGEWQSVAAATVFVGGGIAPARGCGGHMLPSYFLVGDRNPLHHLAKALRTSLAECGAPFVWSLIPGADHGGERRELEKLVQTAAIWTWFSQLREAAPLVPIASQAPVASSSAAAPALSNTSSAPHAAATVAPAARPVAGPASGCAVSANAMHLSWRLAAWGWVLLAFATGVRLRKSKRAVV